MNEYEDRRHTRQRDYDNRDERNKERFQRFDNRTFAGRQNQRSPYGSDERWREDRGDWRNEAARHDRFGQDAARNYDNDRYGNERYSNEIYNDSHYGDGAYRGLKYSDRERRNSQYSNPDYRYRNDYPGIDYISHGDLRDRESGLTEGQREAYNEVIFSRGAYSPNVDGRSLGNRQHISHRGKGPKNYIRQDVNIKEDVNHSLSESHSVDASDIEVMVQDGNVILSGTVDSRVARRDAESAIDYIPGIRNIENRIHIKSQTNSTIRGEASANKMKSQASATSISDAKRNGKTTT